MFQYSKNTPKITNLLSSYSDGRNKTYSAYKILTNLFVHYLDGIRSQLDIWKKTTKATGYGVSETLANVWFAENKNVDDNTLIDNATINDGFVDGYTTKTLKKSTSLTHMLSETPPDIIEPILPDATSYIDELFNGEASGTILGSGLNNGGFLGASVPIFFIVNDTRLYKMVNGDIISANISVYGTNDNGRTITETISIPYPGVFKTIHNYSSIDKIIVNAPDTALNLAITTIPPADDITEPFYQEHSPDRKVHHYKYVIDADNHILLKHYVANTPEEWIAIGDAMDTDEYITIVDNDGVPIPETIEQVIPSPSGELLYVKAGDYLYIVPKSKHLPGTLEKRNLLKEVFENGSRSSLVKIKATRMSHNSYDIDTYYYRDHGESRITSYKLILHTADGKHYYYDPENNNFIETDLPDPSLPFNSFASGDARGFYLKNIEINDLPVGDNYISIIYLIDGKTEERYYEFMPVEYRIYQSRILIQDDAHSRPYGPYSHFAFTGMGTLLAYNKANSTPDAGALSDPYPQSHSLIENPGCTSVVVPLQLTNSSYVVDRNNGVYTVARTKSITLNSQEYTSYPSKTLTYLDELGTIWQLSRNNDEYLVAYAYRLFKTIGGGVGSSKKTLVNYLCNATGAKQMRSFSISHPSYPNGIIAIESGVFYLYADDSAYAIGNYIDSHDAFQYETINDFLTALQNEGYNVTVYNNILLNLSPAAIQDGSNLTLVPDEKMSLGYRHTFERHPVAAETLVVYGNGWMSSFTEKASARDNFQIPSLTKDQTEFENATEPIIYVDETNNQILTNYNVDELVYLYYYVYDENYAFIVSPIFIVDLSKSAERRSMMSNSYAPQPKNDELFSGIAAKNLARWGK